MEPLPTFNKAYASIVCEERQLQFAQGMEARPFMEGSPFKASASALRYKPGGGST